MKEKPNVGSIFWGDFPSDRIPKGTKDVELHFFIHSNNSCKLYRLIRERFEAIRKKESRRPPKSTNPPSTQYLPEILSRGEKGRGMVNNSPLTSAEV